MGTFKTIVLTTDLSANADAAVPYAASLAKQSGGTIHLFHAYEPDAAEALSSGVVVGVSEWLAEMREQREKKLAERARVLEEREDVKVLWSVAVGHPAHQAVEYAKSIHADSIVIATHGRTGVPHLLMGSVAERVARLSPVPVLSIHPGHLPPSSGVIFDSIVLATDFSENAMAAEACVLELARQHGARIILAHVVEDSVYAANVAMGEGIGVDLDRWLESVKNRALQDLDKAATTLAARSGLKIETALGQGRAAEQLGKIAEERQASLIAIATHGYTGLSHLLFGSVAERVLRISQVPVLSIRPTKLATRM